MCALFGQGVTIYQVALEPEAPAVHREAPLEAPAIQSVAMPEVRSQREPLATTTATVSRQPLAIEVASRREPIEPVAVSQNLLSAARFAARVHQAPALPPVRVKRDLAFMRDREVLRRALPARSLSPEQQAYWVKRLSDAKRISARVIELVGLFPDVALGEDQPVRYRAEAHALAYVLPDKPVPLSTVVVARHRTTGEVILGRFHKG